MKVGIALTALAALLTACASPAEIAARDDATCKGYGFTPGTPAFADCRLRLDEMRNLRRAALIASE